MKPKIIFHQDFAKIHYQNQYKRVRISTGIRLNSKSDLKGKSNGELSKSFSSKKKDQPVIDKLLGQATDIYRDFRTEHGKEPTVDEFKMLWKGFDAKGKDNELLHRFAEYKGFKEKEFKLDDKPQSLKDYTALEKRLQDYQVHLGKTILLNDVSRQWIVDFQDFITTERSNWIPSKEGGKYHVKQPVKSKETLSKRIGTFKRFFVWLDDEGFFEMPKWLFGYQVDFQKTDVIKSVLNEEEVNLLTQAPMKNKTHEFIRDSFVFSCMTGVRWSDMTTLSKDDIYDMPNGKMLIKNAVKTGTEFQVYLHDKALAILERYDYNLNRESDPVYNRELKKILKVQPWCQNKISVNGKKIERWKAISHHRGRDSFITMLITKGVPLNEIMKHTGHRTVSNLNKYIDLTLEPKNHIKGLFS